MVAMVTYCALPKQIVLLALPPPAVARLTRHTVAVLDTERYTYYYGDHVSRMLYEAFDGELPLIRTQKDLLGETLTYQRNHLKKVLHIYKPFVARYGHEIVGGKGYYTLQKKEAD